MSKAREIGGILLWTLGHLAFTLIVNLTVMGGYYGYLQYREVVAPKLGAKIEAAPNQFSLSNLDNEGLNELAKNVFIEQRSRKDG